MARFRSSPRKRSGGGTRKQRERSKKCAVHSRNAHLIITTISKDEVEFIRDLVARQGTTKYWPTFEKKNENGGLKLVPVLLQLIQVLLTMYFIYWNIFVRMHCNALVWTKFQASCSRAPNGGCDIEPLARFPWWL